MYGSCVDHESTTRAVSSWGPSPRRSQQIARPGRLERAKQVALELALEGGYDAWREMGYPLVPAEVAVHAE